MEKTGDSIKKVICVSCKTEYIPISQEGINCRKGHHLCHTCSPNYINSIFNHPLTDIPARCSVKACRAEIDYDDVDKYMKGDDLKDKYNLYASITDISSNERLVCCNRGCGSIQLWRNDYKSPLFYCLNPECSVGTCLVCLNEIKYPKDEKNLSSEESKMVGSEYWYKTHEEECGKYIRVIKIREIIEKCNVRACPSCGYSGRKDDCCTHMTCERCGAKYCYICGILDKYLDKSDPNGSIDKHNDDCDTNEKRCPMYLYRINPIDNSWPKEDEDCQAYLHMMITKINLRNYGNTIGKEEFLSLLRKFPDIEDNSFDLKHIFEEDLTLIKRKKK